MTQLALPLTLSPNPYGFEEVRRRRDLLYGQRSPELLDRLDLLMEHFGTDREDEEESPLTLYQINRLVVDLGALNPAFLELSMLVFETLLDYEGSQRSVLGNRLRAKYERDRRTF